VPLAYIKLDWLRSRSGAVETDAWNSADRHDQL